MRTISFIIFCILFGMNGYAQSKKGNWAAEFGSFFSSTQFTKEIGNGTLSKATGLGVQLGAGYYFKINERIDFGLGLNALIYPFVYDIELLTSDYPSLEYNYYRRFVEHNVAYELPLLIQYKLRVSNRLDIVPNLGIAFRGFLLPASTFSVKSSGNNRDMNIFFIKNEYASGLNLGLSSSISLNYSFSNLSTLGLKINFGFSLSDLAVGQYALLEGEPGQSSGRQVMNGTYIGTTFIYNFSPLKYKK